VVARSGVIFRTSKSLEDCWAKADEREMERTARRSEMVDVFMG
jgi:hypothetical protein